MRILIYLLLLWLPAAACAQTRLTGRVSGEKGEYLANVMVKAYAVGKSSPTAYTKTNDRGEYVLLVGESAGKEVDVKFSVLGYHTAARRIKNQTARIDMQLRTDPTGLREVTVKAPTVRAHGDTLTFNVENLRGKTDRNMEDVIRRIPGISIENSGQIKYNGEAINRFYIEGADLLDGRYSLATHNISPEDVASVNVYENHQPVRMLEGVEQSRQAALNLKLKNSRLRRPVGNALAGAGWGKELTWKGELFGLMASSRRQHLATLKANNFSQNYENESQTHYPGLHSEDRALAADVLPDRPFSTPNVPSERYLNNRSALASLNNLLKLKNDLTLTANADYTLTDNDYAMQAQTAYATGEEAQVVATDDNRTDLTRHKAALRLKWERNAATRYVLNHLSLRGDWKRNDYALYLQGIRQHNRQDAFGATNQLRWMGRKGKRVTQVFSYLSFNQVPKGYLAAWDEVAGGNSMRQQVEGLSFTSRHSTSLGWLLGEHGKWGRVSMVLGIKADYHRIDLAFSGVRPTGAPSTDTPTPSQGGTEALQPAPAARADGYSIVTTIGPTYNGHVKRLGIEFSLPVSMYNLRFQNHRSNEACPLNRPFFRPGITLTLGRINRLFALFSANYEYRIGSLREFVQEPVYLTFRQLTELGSGQLSKTKALRVTGQFRWNAPVVGRHFNAQGGFSRTEDNRLWSSHIGPDGQLTGEALPGATVQTSWNGSFSLGKTYYGKRLYLLLQGGINTVRSPLVRQGERLETSGRAGQVSASAEKHLFDERLSLTLSASWQRYASRTSGSYRSRSLLDDYTGMLRVAVFPVRSLEVYGQGRFMANGAPGSRFDRQFYVDAGLRWRLRSVELELKGRNLTNCDTYLYRLYALSDLTTYVYRLRPAECLLTAKWNF